MEQFANIIIVTTLPLLSRKFQNFHTQASQGQFGVKSEIFGERSSPVLGGYGGMPPSREIFEILVQNGAFWGHISTSLSSSPAGYTYTRADRRSIGRAANWIYSLTVECVWFTNRCVRAWHDRWMRETCMVCIRVVFTLYPLGQCSHTHGLQCWTHPFPRQPDWWFLTPPLSNCPRHPRQCPFCQIWIVHQIAV